MCLIYRKHDILPRIRLNVEVDEIRAGGAKPLHIAHGALDHEVDVEKHIRRAAQRLDHRNADGDIRNEKPVHNIDVQPVRPRFLNILYLRAETRKIRGQYGRGELYHNATPLVNPSSYILFIILQQIVQLQY